MASGAPSAPRPHRRDKPCWRCGYSLRRLPPESRNCPECGLAVRISLSGDLSLHIADPRWLTRLAVGAVACAVAATVPLAVLILTGTVDLTPDTLVLVTATMILLTTLALLVGWWTLALPASYGMLETQDRFIGVFRAITSAVALLCAMLVVLPALQRSVSYGMIVTFFVSFFAAQLVHLICLFRLQTLLSRHTDRRLRKWVLAATWIALVGLLLPFVAGGTWELLLPLLEQGERMLLLRVVLGLLMIAYVCLWLWVAVVLRRVGADAERTWVSD